MAAGASKSPATRSAASDSRGVLLVRRVERAERVTGKLLLSAEVVKWQTRTFEGRVAQAVRVQVPPSAPN